MHSGVGRNPSNNVLEDHHNNLISLAFLEQAKASATNSENFICYMHFSGH
jgi:hypothetical protein